MLSAMDRSELDDILKSNVDTIIRYMDSQNQVIKTELSYIKLLGEKTNGRVTALENQVDQLEEQHQEIRDDITSTKGSWDAIKVMATFIGGILAGVIIYYLTKK